jgi:hypothetical protein
MVRGALFDTVERLAALDVASLSNEAALAALGDARRVQSWAEGRTAALRRRVKDTSTSPAAGRDDANEASGSSKASGRRDEQRAKATDAIPEAQEALDDGTITGEHVDVIAAALARLEAPEQAELALFGSDIVADAAAHTPDEFRDHLRDLVDSLLHDQGQALRERQKRAARLRTFTDRDSGMVCINGRLDPEMGALIVQQLDAALRARFAQATPPFCPSDPRERADWLRAHALADLVSGGSGAGSGSRAGSRADVTIVVTTPGQADGAGGTGGAAWTCPPGRVDSGGTEPVSATFVTDLVRRGAARVFTVITANGQVISAPGALDLGYDSRLANRAQRRALHALYPNYAIPSCRVDYRHCTLHHIVWWRHGGRTDLANLLPVCSSHHHAIHDEQWVVTLGPHRELTVRRPDGRVLTTGPPGRAP